ncbi:MAG: hypothetical protein HYS15_03660, partial [Candidatus Spechtbacteria bacterium]|nr:hypothetical protein [Candidatus Spechtbacteria bacterium]
MTTRTAIEDIERIADQLMRKHRISPTIGFLAEHAWENLLWISGDDKSSGYLTEVHLIADLLPELTKRGLVAKNVAKMTIPAWPLETLPW